MSETEHPDTVDTLCLAGGMALIVLGAGLLVARPTMRRLFQTGIAALGSGTAGPMSGGIGAMLPDMERYLKIKSM